MKKKVLILCTGNSCRSQMAEGLLRNLAKDKFNVFSAGVVATYVNPYAIKVMREVGIDISKHNSKSVNDFINDPFNYVITVCDHARQNCPTLPGKYKKISWDIKDPVATAGTDEEILKVFRKTRDALRNHLLQFIKDHTD